MTKVLGLDQASTSGSAVIDNGQLVHHGKKTFEGEWVERVSEIKKYMMDLITEYSPDIVAIEDVQFQQNQKVFGQLSQLKGVLENYLFENEIDYRVVPSATWKSIMNIKKQGREKEKKQAQEEVLRMFDIKVSSDVADAVCISYSVWSKNK